MSDPIIFPVLETDRLQLRSFAQSDLDPFAEMLADSRVVEYATYSGRIMNRSQAWNWMCMMLGHWHLRGFGIWAVEEKATGNLVGRIGLQRLDWFEEVELVWMLAHPAWGKGYAAEGAEAAIRYGFEVLELPQLSAVIHVENQRSIRLAERMGMYMAGELEREGIQFYDYRADRATFR